MNLIWVMPAKGRVGNFASITAIACSHPCTPGSPLNKWRSCDNSRV
ncbi:hypothetical protein HMPREF9538_04522 [Klebsiella sp. MS 92-3]|nr:hypothetical protein HMPREF9538_04522 [Klebsiella sp. MS 92-3]